MLPWGVLERGIKASGITAGSIDKKEVHKRMERGLMGSIASAG